MHTDASATLATFLSIRNWVLLGVLIRLRLPLAQVLRLQVKDLSLETGALALKNTTVALPAELIAAFVGYFRQFPERLRSNGPLLPSRRGQAMDRLAFRRRIVEPALRQWRRASSPAVITRPSSCWPSSSVCWSTRSTRAG